MGLVEFKATARQQQLLECRAHHSLGVMLSFSGEVAVKEIHCKAGEKVPQGVVLKQ